LNETLLTTKNEAKFMQILNRFYKVNTRGLNKINPEIDYLKNEEIKKRKKQFENFRLLLEQNKSLKKPKRLSYGQIASMAGISRATYYRIKEKVEKKGLTYWQTLEKQSTRPKKVKYH